MKKQQHPRRNKPASPSRQKKDDESKVRATNASLLEKVSDSLGICNDVGMANLLLQIPQMEIGTCQFLEWFHY